MSKDVRDDAGDRIVQKIFSDCNDLQCKENIENRVIILEELFSTNIKRFSSDEGINVIVQILLKNHEAFDKITNQEWTIDCISKFVCTINTQYKEATKIINNKGCQSFLTKYLFWHAWSKLNKYDNRFFIFDNVVKRAIKFNINQVTDDWYKNWFIAINSQKKDLAIKCNRAVDYKLWKDQKEQEKREKKAKKEVNI